MTRNEAMAILMSRRCVCSRSKPARLALCRSCYAALPRELQRALYRPYGAGFEEAYTEAAARAAPAERAAAAGA